MSHRLILFFILLASAQLSFGAEQQARPAKVIELSESQKLKLEQKIKQEEDLKRLVNLYGNFSDTITASDLIALEKLFNALLIKSIN